MVTQAKERRKTMSAGKERRRRKKARVALSVFVIATLEIVFDRKKKLLDAKGPFSDNVFKNRG